MRRRASPSLVILTCLLVWAIISQLNSALTWGHDSYQMTEWLINYAGGFVRRGLPGAIIGKVSGATGIQANYLVIGTSLACYLALAAWFLCRSTRIFPAALILSCIVMGFPAYQDSIVRKDCLGLLFLLGCLKADDSRLPRPASFFIINLLAGAAILSHEAFVFYALPAFVLFGSLDRPTTMAIVPAVFRRSLKLLPAAGVFLLTAWYHGTPEIANAVHESWMPLWHSLVPNATQVLEPAASIRALGWDSAQGLSLSIYMLTTGFYQPLAWLMVFTVSFFLVVVFTGRDVAGGASPRMEAKVRVTALLSAQLVYISPLFLLGVDYGRWLFLWVASSLMLQTTRRSAPAWLEVSVANLFKRAKVPTWFGQLPVSDWYLLFFGVPVCWNLYNFLAASPAIRLIEIIRSEF